MPRNTVTTVDPQRLMVATHEMGHAIAWHHAGFSIGHIEVRGRGSSTTGVVQLENLVIRTPDQARDYMIGLLAGREADHTWCDITGQSPDNHGPSHDLDIYRRVRKHDAHHDRFIAHFTDAELRAAARKVVTAHWAQIERFAEQLADRGTVRL